MTDRRCIENHKPKPLEDGKSTYDREWILLVQVAIAEQPEGGRSYSLNKLLI